MRFNLLAIFTAALLYALTNASPLPLKPSMSLRTVANVARLYRGGNAKTPVPKMREQDWNIKDGHVHPSDNKGLSTNTNPKNLGPGHKWSIPSNHVTDPFKAVHDGPNGHVTLAYKGQPAPVGEVHKAVQNLPWKHEGKK